MVALAERAELLRVRAADARKALKVAQVEFEKEKDAREKTKSELQAQTDEVRSLN